MSRLIRPVDSHLNLVDGVMDTSEGDVSYVVTASSLAQLAKHETAPRIGQVD